MMSRWPNVVENGRATRKSERGDKVADTRVALAGWDAIS